MAPLRRQMHLGVFWLGTGNHTAGWRYKGAATSNNSWPVVAAGAQTAFISDSVVMDPGDHPSFISRFEPRKATCSHRRKPETLYKTENNSSLVREVN